MPRIETYTATGTPGIQQAVEVSPNSFGAQGFRGVSELGQTVHAIGQKIQDNQDRLDLTKVAGEFAVRLDQKKADILLEPDIKKHQALLDKAIKDTHDKLLEENPDMSSEVQNTFAQHVAQSYAPAAIEVAHAGRVLQVERQIVEVDQAGKQNAATYGRELYPSAATLEGMANANHTLETMSANGTIHPKAAETIKKEWANTFWEQRAISNPNFTQYVANTGEARKDALPMDPNRTTYYHNLAQAQINANDKARAAYKKEEVDVIVSNIRSAMWGLGKGAAGARDVSADIEAVRQTIGGDEFQKLMKENLEVQNAQKQFTFTGGKRRVSEYVQSNLLYTALRAKYEPDLIDRGVINFDVVLDHVTKKGDLHPDDAAPVYEAISAAMAYHNSGDSTLRKAQTDAIKSLEVHVPQLASVADSTTLKNIQDSMQRQLRAEMYRKPAMTPVEVSVMADTIRAQGEKRVLSAQHLSAQQIDEELFGMETHWNEIDPSLVGNKHELKPASRTELEKKYPLLKGLFKIHDARRLRWVDMENVGSEQKMPGKK